MRNVHSMIRLNAGNDVNGNPRRVYVHMVNGNIRAAYDEGYAGAACVPFKLATLATNACTFETTPREYRQLLKEHGKDA